MNKLIKCLFVCACLLSTGCAARWCTPLSKSSEQQKWDKRECSAISHQHGSHYATGGPGGFVGLAMEAERMQIMKECMEYRGYYQCYPDGSPSAPSKGQSNDLDANRDADWEERDSTIANLYMDSDRLKKDKQEQKLAYVPKTGTSASVFLRKEPKNMLSKYAVRTMLKNHNFFDSEWNPNGSFDNDFVDNGDGTVTDKTTGLMWQRVGSPRALTLKYATYYINSLNDKRFMGYSDWRMPTVEELASIITRSANSGFHINPLFAKKQKLCWSTDSGTVEDEYMKDVWIANFAKGRVVLYMLEDRLQLIGDYMETYYVRGVRSVR